MIRLSRNKIEPHEGRTRAEMLRIAHEIRVTWNGKNVVECNLSEALDAMAIGKGLSPKD